MFAFRSWTVQSYIASRVRAEHMKVSGQSTMYAFLFDKLINIHLLTILLYTTLHQKSLHQRKDHAYTNNCPSFSCKWINKPYREEKWSWVVLALWIHSHLHAKSLIIINLSFYLNCSLLYLTKRWMQRNLYTILKKVGLWTQQVSAACPELQHQ